MCQAPGVTEREVTGEVVHIAELVADLDPAMLVDREFTDCQIVGPAVLTFSGPVALDDITVEAGSWWPVARDVPLVGAIGLRDVRFTRCRFRAIGWAADEATAAALMIAPAHNPSGEPESGH